AREPGPVKPPPDDRLPPWINTGRGEDRSDARRAPRGRDVHGDKFGGRMRAAHDAGVQHAWQLDVVDVAALPTEQALELPPRNARANAGRRCLVYGHWAFPPALAMTASTASTMAW